MIPEAQLSLVDRKSTRLNSSHLVISYAVFCLKKKKRKAVHAALAQAAQRNDLQVFCVHLSGPVLARGRQGSEIREQGIASAAGRCFFLMIRRPPTSSPFPYTALSQ